MVLFTLNAGKSIIGNEPWRILCSHCRHQQYLLLGIIFQKCPLKLMTWVHAMEHIFSEKNGGSALGLHVP